MNVNQALLNEVHSCCHHGHGASIFADGTVMQAISSNDIIARSDGQNGWEYRVAYVDNPRITLDELREILA